MDRQKEKEGRRERERGENMKVSKVKKLAVAPRQELEKSSP